MYLVVGYELRGELQLLMCMPVRTTVCFNRALEHLHGKVMRVLL